MEVQTELKELIKREEVEGTPFTIVTTENGSFGILGEFRITEVKPIEVLREDLKYVDWNRIVQVVMILINKMQKQDIFGGIEVEKLEEVGKSNNNLKVVK